MRKLKSYYILFNILLLCLSCKENRTTIIDKSKIDNSDLYNTTLVGLSPANTQEEKYIIDFVSQCMCNAPSFYIDKNSGSFLIFNYCEQGNPPSNLKQSFKYKIEETQVVKKRTSFKIISLKDSESLTVSFTKLKEHSTLYEVDVKGDFPKEYIGQRINSHFTTDKSKFKVVDCGDFDG